MRISDWSSDVCSSDLEKQAKAQFERERDQQRANDAALSSRENRIALAGILFAIGALGAGAGLLFHSQRQPRNAQIAGGGGAALKIRRAACRDRVCPYGELSGVGVSFQKKPTAQ